MAKNKTRVQLPGGIQGLVHDLQNNTSNFAPKPLVDEEDIVKEEKRAEETQAEKVYDSSMVIDAEGDVVSEPIVRKDITIKGEVSDGSRAAASATNREAVEVEKEQVAAEAERSLRQPDEAAAPRENGERADGREGMKEYRIVKDNSKDSWDLFLDMALQYKNGGGKLATIYIDDTLKSVLDRMKYAGPDKLSTAAILSSIVARFIYDHEEEIKKALFSGKLI